MDDNLYPNDGEQMGAYDTRAAAPKTSPLADKNTMQKDVFKWFQTQINQANDIGSIQIDTLEINGYKYTREASIEGQLLAQQLLVRALTDKKNELKDYLDGLYDK